MNLEAVVYCLFCVLFFALAIIFWFLPVFIAKKRQTEDIGVITVLTILGIFGGITWIIALCMACFKQSNKQKVESKKGK